MTAVPVTHVLRTGRQYDAAARELDALLDREPRPGTPAFDRLELLTVLIEAYDREHDPMDEKIAPRDVVAFMMDQKGVTRAQLAEWLGGRSRVSEFFRGRRRLSLTQIRTLRDRLGIPADLLLEDADGTPKATIRLKPVSNY